MTRRKLVDVGDLEIGMYVAELDRPWLETPFLFQGFYIRDDDEIAELREYCRQVYVSCETLPPSKPEARAINGSSAASDENNGTDKPNKGFSLRSLFSFGRGNGNGSQPAVVQTNVFYDEETGLGAEIKTATKVQQKVESTVQNVMDNLRANGNLDYERLQASVSPMVDSVLRNPAALACLMRLQKKNDYLYQHSLASSVWATILGRQIGLHRDDMNVLAVGAMVLDVGKTQIPNEILQKPDKLDDAEKKLMRRHVQFGLEILEASGSVDERVLEMVEHHHERFNGTGYPRGLSGNSIPVFGRIAAIVDAYDAMITPRPYAKHVSSHDALRQLRKLADVEFQAEIVEQFTRAIGVFPTGTLVELNTGDIAIVTRQNAIRRLRPEVMVIMDRSKKTLDQFKILDLNCETVNATGDSSLWIEKGLPPGSHGINPTEYFID